MMFRVTLEKNEEYPVYSIDTDLYGWNEHRQVEITPDEFYTASMYENLRYEAQKYCYSFVDRLNE